MQAITFILVPIAAAGAVFWFVNRPQRVEITGELPVDFPADGFSHRVFERLLTTYVSPQGNVDYARWQASAESVELLNSYLVAVARFSPATVPGRFPDAAAELAYWMYAYNAYVIKSVIDHWPLESVTDVKAPLEAVKGMGFFYRQRFAFGGEYMSLLTVENGIIRKRYRDPRIHFVLSCASESCPAVRPELPVGDDLEVLMQQAAAEFISDPRNVSVDHEAREVRLSTIFKWYRKDFVDYARFRGMAAAKDAVDYISLVAPKSLAQELSQAEDYKRVYRDYDWSLNAA